MAAATPLWYAGADSRVATSEHPARHPQAVAAVDLGSNSFHMVVAQLADGEVRILDRLRERVALAEGLDAGKLLDREAQERALACLARFGQRLRDIPSGRVRAVGTSALRLARNAPGFLASAREALGHPIEVISGREEARLVYLGVSHSIAGEPDRRLVVDIGGGSTECILGEGFETIRTDSLHMGCVNYSLRFFPGGEITREALLRAEIAAAQELEPIARVYKTRGWEACIGSSGTILSIEAILREGGWSERGVTERGLKKLSKALLEAGHASRLSLPGMAEDRAPVLAGGFAILRAAFRSLSIERMLTSQGALREGVLFDLAGRMRHQDARDETIRSCMQRYDIDRDQASRVERTALALLDQVAGSWGVADGDARRLLSWAARLHEIGLSVNHSGYHKHGAYLVAHGFLPGFSGQDQESLAVLIGAHRRKLGSAQLDSLPSLRAALALKLSVLLRLAVLLNRSRSPRPLPAIRLSSRGSLLELRFPDGWLDGHSLTRMDLEEETSILRTVGIELVVA